jgi:hypothetical protein
MAIKKKLNVPVNENIEEEGRNGLTWKEWTTSVFLKYWYILFAITFNSFVSLELAGHDEIDLRWAIVAVFLLLAILTEAMIYIRVWGNKGIWNLDSEDD